MVDLDSRADRTKLRHVVMNAEDKEVMSKEEAGFVVSLVERFRVDIEKKVKQLHVLTGEIAQLKANEQIVINLIENMVAAAERDIARRETMDKLKAAREVHEERKQALKEASPSEQSDTIETDADDVKQD